MERKKRKKFILKQSTIKKIGKISKQKNISKNAYLHKCLDDFFIQKSTQNLFVFQFLKDCNNGNTHI